MIDRRSTQALFVACAAIILSFGGNLTSLRQKTAAVVPTQTEVKKTYTKEEVESALWYLDQLAQVDPAELPDGGTVLVDDPMRGNGPIPVEPEPLPPRTDVEVTVPEGVNDKPVLIEELDVHIDAPVDAMVGDLVKLHAIVVGKPSAIKWLIDPPIDDFETLDGGMRAVFSNRNVGVYHVVCSVAGNDGHVDVDTHTFEIVPQPPENPLTPQTVAQLTPQLSVEELIKRWLAEVRSPNKIGEAHAIAGSFRSVSSTLRSGNIPGPDLLRSVEEASEIAVGPQAFKSWKGFFDRTREFLLPLNAARTVFTPDQYANTFENIATVLETLTAVEQN